jgi:hypothetical protein
MTNGYGMPNGMPSGMPSGMQGMPNGMPSGMPSGMQGMPSGMQGMQGMNQWSPPIQFDMNMNQFPATNGFNGQHVQYGQGYVGNFGF